MISSNFRTISRHTAHAGLITDPINLAHLRSACRSTVSSTVSLATRPNFRSKGSATLPKTSLESASFVHSVSIVLLEFPGSSCSDKGSSVFQRDISNTNHSQDHCKMFKTRGKPEDPWNVAAQEQEKGLAAAIHVNQIRRNGFVPLMQSEITNPVQRREIERRHQNYREFRETYHNRIKKSSVWHSSSKCERRPEVIDYNHDIQVMKRFVGPRINDRRNYDNTRVNHKPVILRAPLRTVKPVNMEAPGAFSEDGMFYPPQLGEGESLNFFHKIKQLEFDEPANSAVGVEESVQTDVVRELQQAHFEADISNAQLEEIKKILMATKMQVNEEAGKAYKKNNKGKNCANTTNTFYTVQNATIPKKGPIYTPAEKEDCLSKKSKLLLTLNDVHQRIQKLQSKFFTENRPRYKTVKNFFGLPKRGSVEVLYKNVNYDCPLVTKEAHNTHNETAEYSQQTETQESLIPPVHVDHIRPHSANDACRDLPTRLQRSVNRKPLSMQKTQTKRSHELQVQHRSAPLQMDIAQPSTSTYSPRKQHPDSGIPYLNMIGDHFDGQEFYNHYGNDYADFEDTEAIKDDNLERDYLEQDIVKEANENLRKSFFKPKLQESILKSSFLMKEFDIDPKNMHIDMSRLPPISENKKSVQFAPHPLHKFQKEQINVNYTKVRNRPYYNPIHTMLKDTLYSTDFE